MPISWNEIKSRALAFSKEWENDSREDAEAKRNRKDAAKNPNCPISGISTS